MCVVIGSSARRRRVAQHLARTHPLDQRRRDRRHLPVSVLGRLLDPVDRVGIDIVRACTP
jgi:hypothetical protein